MRGSYAMMDAIGRFYSNADGGHRYGPSVIEVGVQQAWEDICFFEERFLKRGGIYEWNQPNQAQTEVYEWTQIQSLPFQVHAVVERVR